MWPTLIIDLDANSFEACNPDIAQGDGLNPDSNRWLRKVTYQAGACLLKLLFCFACLISQAQSIFFPAILPLCPCDSFPISDPGIENSIYTYPDKY